MEKSHFLANVLNFGADPTGILDSTAAIQAACDSSDHVYLPAGTYLVGHVEVTGHATLLGAGDHATTLKSTCNTGNVLTFLDHGWHVRDLGFDAVADRTDGAYIYAAWKQNREFPDSTAPGAANFATIENVALTRQYVGIDLDGCWSVNIAHITAFDGTDDAVAPGGAVIRLGRETYTGPVHIRGLTARTSSPDRQPTSGIHMGHVDVVSISDTLIIYHRKNIWVTPGPEQFSALIEVTNSCLDTAHHGIYIEPNGGGRVLRCGFSNTWFGAHCNDAMVIDGRDGVVTGLQFSNCMFLANAGDGVRITGQGVDGLYFSNCFSGGNLGCGLRLCDGAKNVQWLGGVLGRCHELNGNVQFGYTAEPGCTGQIALANLAGNQAGAYQDEHDVIHRFALTEG